MKKCPTLITLISLFCVSVSMLTAGEIFVSPTGNDANSGTKDAPYATIERARDRIREENARTDKAREAWTVTLAEGEYALKKPIEFTPADSGTKECPILYQGAKAGKVILTGGLDITGWKVEADGTWSATLPDFEGNTLYFEQMWVNGRRAARSRYPNDGFLKMAEVKEEFPMGKDRKSEVPRTRQWATGKPGELDFLKSVPVEELKWGQMIIHHNWDTTRRILLGFDAETNTVETKGGNMKFWNPWRDSSLYYFENVRTGFDAPGEWFYDGNAKKVYYRPMDGESLENTRFCVPRPGLVQFLLVLGKSQNEQVTDIRFENLTFSYSDTPRQKDVMENAQIDVSVTGDLDKPGPSQFEPAQAAFYTKTVVMVDEGLRIGFKKCEFSHIGEYGIWFRNAVECSFCDGKLYDLGAGGIRIGGGHSWVPAESIRCAEKNVIDNNIISNGGRFHASAVGVWIGNNTVENELTHNEIADFFYTGVSVGWHWGYAGVSFRNRIEFNRIHDIGQGALADMGGVYTLGTQTGTRVCNNVIYNVESYGYGGWGLYTDEGSEGITMENNLVYDTMDGSFHQHYGKDNVIRNNILARNKPNPMRDGPAHQVAVTRVEEHRSVIFENNIIYWKDGTSIGYRVDDVKADIQSNLWWKDGGEVEFKGKTHDQWVAEGKDVGGLVADPMFVDPDKNDFHLKPGSPAEKVGFKVFDYEKAGLRR